ncbi:MAG: helix-turn-helix domain-containing protein [Cyanobacteria bacterium K_Offshore_0m_m2_072]|nr:helix-turn-helix domain-containing protein [Cyanobacteria bacterium K_Offshore_0m_m2_072]
MAAGRPGCQCPASGDDGRPEGPPEAPPGGPAGDQAAAARAASQGQSAGGGGGVADRLKKDSGLLGRGRGRLTAAEDRRKALEILDAAVTAGVRAREVAALLGVGLTTLQRWRRQFAGDGDGLDGRKGSHPWCRIASRRKSASEFC